MKKWLKKLTIFDWLIVFLILASLIFLSSFTFKKEKWLKVEVRVGPEQWWWDYKPAPYWVADSIKKGEAQFDSLGRKIAEVLETQIYEWGETRKDIYLLLNLKVDYNRKKRTYRFNYQPVEIGKPLNLELGGIGFQSLVVSIEGLDPEEKKVIKIVEAKLMNVYPWVAETISIGDQMKDNQGKVMAKVLDKKIELADMTVVTDQGVVLARKDPLKRDVFLKLKLSAVEQHGIYYFREGQEIKIGLPLSIQLPDVHIENASIMKILE